MLTTELFIFHQYFSNIFILFQDSSQAITLLFISLFLQSSPIQSVIFFSLTSLILLKVKYLCHMFCRMTLNFFFNFLFHDYLKPQSFGKKYYRGSMHILLTQPMTADVNSTTWLSVCQISSLQHHHFYLQIYYYLEVIYSVSSSFKVQRIKVHLKNGSIYIYIYFLMVMVLRILNTKQKVLHLFNEIMGVHQIYCGNHLMISINQIIMLYTLNSYSAICLVYLKKLKEIMVRICTNHQCNQQI